MSIFGANGEPHFFARTMLLLGRSYFQTACAKSTTDADICVAVACKM